MPQCPPEPLLVLEALRQRAPFVQDFTYPLAVAKRVEGVALFEAQVNLLLGPLTTFGQLLEGAPRLLEVAERLPQAGAVERAVPRLAAIADRLLPQLPAQRVVCDALHVLCESVHVEPLRCCHNLGVQFAPPVLQQTAIGHFMGQRVLEGVLEIREELRLVEELSFLQVREPGAEDLLGLLSDRR